MNKTLIIAILFIIPLTTVFAETTKLDRKTSLDLALENNIDLLKKAIDLESSQRAKENAQNLYYPSISVSLQASDSMDLITDDFSQSTSLIPSLSASYSFKPGLAESIKELENAFITSEINYETLKLELIKNVETEFYYLLTTKGSLEIQKKNIDLAQRLYEQTEAKYNNGLLSELEVLQAKVNAANLVPSYISAESDYENSLKEFLQVLGIDPSSEVELTGELEFSFLEIDGEELAAEHIDNRTDIILLKQQLVELENSLNSAVKTNTLPTVSLSAALSDSINDFHTADGWSSFSPSLAATFSLGISYGLDTFLPSSESSLEVMNIEDSIKQMELTIEDTIQNARLEILNLVDSLETDKSNIELSKLNQELSQTSYEVTLSSYERGISDRITLDDARQDLLTAEQNLLESKYNYLKDLIELRSALGLTSFEF